MKRIFISYRRQDTAGHAQRLHELLEVHFPGEVFFDTETLQSGERWPKEIPGQFDSCELMLLAIGPMWLKASDPESWKRRLDDSADWVRREIETGLERGITVIPVLMGGASLPSDEDLDVESLLPLTKHQTFTLGDRDQVDAERIRAKLGAPISNTTQYTEVGVRHH